MSDATDEIGFRGQQLLNKSKTNPLRERMKQFLQQQETTDLKQLRSQVATGKSLSEMVEEDREERL